MNNYSLSVYRIRINKHLLKKTPEILSDFDNGKDFLNLIDRMFLSWKENKVISPVVKDDNAKKVSRLMKDNNDKWIYHRHQTYISGIIESGDYGTQEDIIDIKTGKSKYTKTPTDASLVPFFFMFYIVPNKDEGYLILERIGNIGVLSVLYKVMVDFLTDELSQKYTLIIEPYLIPEILKLNLNSAEGAKKIVLKGVNNNQFKNFVSTDELSGCTTEVSFISPRNKFIQDVNKIINGLMKKKEEDRPYRINNVECTDVAFELDINGCRRTISVAKMTSIGMNVDISNKVDINQTGYPTYDSLFKEANLLLSYLK